MAEYIDRMALRDALYDADAITMRGVEILNQFPAADVRPVVKGEWIWRHRHRGGFHTITGVDAMGETHTITVDERFEIDDPYCPYCGKLNDSSWLNFCPNCGADTREENEW